MNLELISKNRSSIYGITMFWIMLFHSSFTFKRSWMMPLSIAKSTGDCGVDVFLFVSGISLYFSLSKKENSLIGFYIRRLNRIVLPAMLTSVLWYAILAPHRAANPIAFIFDVTGISLFVNRNLHTWFVTMIIICYAIYPLLYIVNKKTGNSFLMLVIMLFICIIMNAILCTHFSVLWNNSSILFRRLPIFVIGSFCGKYVYEKCSLPLSVNQSVFISIIIIAICLLMKKYWNAMIPVYYIYIIMGISCTVLFSIIGNVLVINRITSWFAPITFEVYLCHVKWLYIITRLFPTIGSVGINLAAFILCIITAWLLELLENKVYHKPAFGIKNK